jgi:type IV secretory pathway VirB2 component (pilin)
MKIVAYSKVPAATPFVHLGYLSASTTTTKPIQGLLLGGLVLLFVGLSVAGRRLIERKRSAPPIETAVTRISRFGPVGSLMLVAGIAAIGCAFLFGEKNRIFFYPKDATSDRMMTFSYSVANRLKPKDSSDSAAKLPTQEGQYVLSSALGMSAKDLDHCTDGWNTPLMLRVAQYEGQLKYTVVSAGPDRTWGTQDDITDPGQLKSSI